MEWTNTIRTTLSNASLLDLDSEPPALETVPSSDEQLYTDSLGRQGDNISAVGRGVRQNNKPHRHTEWCTFDPVYGVIEQKTRDMWIQQEKDALARAVQHAKHRVIPPVRGGGISSSSTAAFPPPQPQSST
jgi:hypothetical protein